MNWLMQSLIATGLLVPCWIAIGFFEKNFGVKSDVFLIWYFLGSILTWSYVASSGGAALTKLVPSYGAITAVMLIGVTLGAGANLLLFRAVEQAPNSGLPVAISSSASVLVFFVVIGLAKLWPNLFQASKIDTLSVVGLIFTVLGVSLIAYKR